MAKTIQIADTIHGTIKLNEIEKEVISTQIFNRLHNISQNSTVYLTFPTNRTKRFEHSVGTMYLCGKIFMQSISNADNETLTELFSRVRFIIDTELKENLSKYSDKYRSKLGDKNLSEVKLSIYKTAEISAEYNSFIPINVKDEDRNIYLILFQAIRLSALMHDVGHPPFSHITEYALKEIWDKVQAIPELDRNSRQKEYINALEPYFKTEQDLHEQIGNMIVEKVLDTITDNIPKDKEDDLKTKQRQLFKVLVSEVTVAILKEKKDVFIDLHRIIDGTLDGDRLDYVSRDPISSGINIGVIEYDRIINSMRIIKNKQTNNFLFLPSSKSIDVIEDFFNRRWKMYKQIIFHHRVVKTDYLLQSCIRDLGIRYLSDKNTDEGCTNILPYDISGLWKAIKNKDSHQEFFDLLIQWDDGWLMTILKRHYFDMYLEPKPEEEIILKRLEELLANKKNYFSYVKRVEDFAQLDKQIAKSVSVEYDNIILAVESLVKVPKQQSGNIVFNVDILLEYIKKLGDAIKRDANDSSVIPHGGFILAKIKKVYNNLFEEKWLNNIIIDSVNTLISDSSYKDIFPEIKKIKTGLEKGLSVYRVRNNDIEILRFSDLSNEVNALLTDLGFMPTFYLYVLDEQQYEKIRCDLADIIARKIIEKVVKRFEELK